MKKLLNLAAAISFALCSAHAGTVFLGIGNNEFAGDIPLAAAAIQPYAQTVTTLNNQNQGILTAINNASNNNLGGFGSTDTFVLYYAGHGGLQADGLTEQDHIIGTSTDGGVTFPNTPVTDDQLTLAIQALNGAHPGVGVYIVLDTCFAGAAVADGTDLKATDTYVTGTADATNCAPGVSKFLPLWQAAFAKTGGFLNSDTNHDNVLTLGELFGYTNASNIANGGENPFSVTNGSFANTIVATIPEPATWIISISALGLLLVWRRRGVVS